MSNKNKQTQTPDLEENVHGELVRRLSWFPLRILSIVTGLFLLRGLLDLFSRYCLFFRRRATLRFKDSCLVLDAEWSIFGVRFRQTHQVAPLAAVKGVCFENRQRYIYLLVGFGALAVGTWIGIQWFVDGLRAGYPYLALVGAGIVTAGILIDVAMYTLVPRGAGVSRLAFVLGPWNLRLVGVDQTAATRLLDEIRLAWGSRPDTTP